ncbi:22119_t:CDS:2, partial [Cetraspora pellucida]
YKASSDWPFTMLITERTSTSKTNILANLVFRNKSEHIYKEQKEEAQYIRYDDLIIANCYTDDIKNASIVINSYLHKSEFVVFDLDRSENDPLTIWLRFDILLNLQKEIEARQKCKKRSVQVNS